MKRLIFSLFVLGSALYAEDPKILFQYVPIKNTVVVGFDLEKMISLPITKQLGKLNHLKRQQDFFTFTGVSLNDLDSLLISASSSEVNQEPNYAFILRAKTPFYVEKLVHSMSKEALNEVSENVFKKQTVYSVSSAEQAQTLYFVQLNERTIVVGSSLGVREVLSTKLIAGTKNITHSSSMMELLSKKSAMFFVGVDFDKKSQDQLQQLQGVVPGLSKSSSMSKLRSLFVSFDFLQRSLEMNLTLRCNDKESATAMHQLMNENQKTITTASDKIINKASMASELAGSNVKFNLKLNQNQLERLRDMLEPVFKGMAKKSKSSEESEDALEEEKF